MIESGYELIICAKNSKLQEKPTPFFENLSRGYSLRAIRLIGLPLSSRCMLLRLLI